MSSKTVVVIGGGAAGFFAAIQHKTLYPNNKVILIEKNNKVLSKVKISGGGRCNVTHACINPTELVKNYPRGERELLSCFHQFNVVHTIQWFNEKGVPLKTEADGRMFPETNQSQTIIDTLLNEANKLGVQWRLSCGVSNLIAPTLTNTKWQIIDNKNNTIIADAIIMAGGSSNDLWQIISKLGHKIVAPVPSLFTFNCTDNRIKNLAGVTINKVEIAINKSKFKQQAPLLITHWGFSGPSVLKLSAWAARHLHLNKYEFEVIINFAPNLNAIELENNLLSTKFNLAKKQVHQQSLFEIPLRLWKNLCNAAQISEIEVWANINKLQLKNLSNQIGSATFKIQGKSTNKDEFVTAGGVLLKEVNMKTMQSKLFNSLYFCGEILDIDAITGGFNFQAAWTTGYIAGTNT